MLKLKKIIISLLLCISIFATCCFATTMSEADIKSYFADYFTDGEFDTRINDGYDISLSEQLQAMYTYLDNNDVDYSSYIYWYDYDDGRTLNFLSLGLATIDSISGAYDSGDSNYHIIIYLTDTVERYRNQCEDDSRPMQLSDDYVSSIDLVSRASLTGSTFDTVFTYSNNDIFTNPSSPTPTPGNLFTGILETMTYILGSITIVMNSLIQVDLILFVILASLTISIIYFVVKLLKGFTGNKLVSGKKKRK